LLAARIMDSVQVSYRLAVIELSGSANGENALHPRSGMSGDGAEVRVLALLLERHHELRRLTGGDQRRHLVVDLEVVLHVSHVLHGERDLAGAGERLGREAEEELAGLDLNRLRGRLPNRTGSCE